MGDDRSVVSSTADRVAQGALAAAVLAAGAAMVALPHYRWLAAYGLYTIPSHLLISLLPHEPAILYVGKLYPPGLVATVGAIGSSVAVLLDYWLLGLLLGHGRIRRRLDGSRFYRFAERIFRKAPFLLVLGSALLPVPFYPVKILAVASGYPLARFLMAAVIGRWPRFYLLAIGGKEFQAPNAWLLGAAVVLEALILLGIWRLRKRRRAD